MPRSARLPGEQALERGTLVDPQLPLAFSHGEYINAGISIRTRLLQVRSVTFQQDCSNHRNFRLALNAVGVNSPPAGPVRRVPAHSKASRRGQFSASDKGPRQSG